MKNIYKTEVLGFKYPFLSFHWAVTIPRWAVPQENGRYLKITTLSGRSEVVCEGHGDAPELGQFSRCFKGRKKEKAPNQTAKKQQPKKPTFKNFGNPETSRLAVFFGWIYRLLFNFSSSTDSKTVACICCSNTIMNNECELNIPCSQIGQCQVRCTNKSCETSTLQYSFRIGLFTHFRQRHGAVKCYPNPKRIFKKYVREFFHIVIPKV